MPIVSLTPQFALMASCPADRKRIDYFDNGGVCNGLLLEVRVSQKRTWYLRFADAHGKQRQHKIGRYEDIGWEDVRKTARRLRSEITLGGNPAEAKAAVKAIPTYGELAQRHLNHAKTYQRSYDTTELYMRLHILPRWGKLRVSEISKPAVAQWLAEKSKEGLALASVEKIRVIFGRSFELAIQWETPGVTRNPTRGIKRPPINNARTRYLTSAEALRLQRAVAVSRNPQLKYIVGLLLLTGARVSELLQAEWRHIDLDRQTWLIPTSKTGKPRHVPLSQAAIAIMEQVPLFKDCVYLLPNPRTLKPFTDIKHPWDTARRAAVLSDLRLHDLRHSAASFMINAGIDLFAVGRVLGHADHKSTMRYSHLANSTLLAAVEAGAKRQAVDWAGS